MVASPKINLSSKVQASKDQVSSDLSGEIAVLQLEEGMYYGITGAGTFVWKQIQSGARSVRDLKEEILRNFEVDEARCERDLLKILNQFSDAGLLRIQE